MYNLPYLYIDEWLKIEPMLGISQNTVEYLLEWLLIQKNPAVIYVWYYHSISNIQLTDEACSSAFVGLMKFDMSHGFWSFVAKK